MVFESLRIPPSTHLDVVKKIPPLLKPLGIYQLDFQAEVFDILGPLGRNWSNTTEIRMREEENHPWVVIAKAASFAMDQPLDSVEGVIRWLRSRWDTDWISDVIDQRGPFLSLLLEPVFKRVTERTIWQGRTAHFQTFALSVKKTAPARDAAFDEDDLAVHVRDADALVVDRLDGGEPAGRLRRALTHRRAPGIR